MNYQIKTLFYFLLFFLFCGCGKGEALESEEEGKVCRESRKSHQGCCSSHGGFESNNCTGTQILYTSGGILVCDDGTLSPSCRY